MHACSLCLICSVLKALLIIHSPGFLTWVYALLNSFLDMYQKSLAVENRAETLLFQLNKMV